MIEGRTGEVLGGMGGKFNGKHISAVGKHGENEQHGAAAVIKWWSAREKNNSANLTQGGLFGGNVEKSKKAKPPEDQACAEEAGTIE